MRLQRFLGPIIGVAVLVVLSITAYATKNKWKPWLTKGTDQGANSTEASGHAAHGEEEHEGSERVKLSPQAQANLRLVVEPLIPEDYFRTLLIPGMVVDRPGVSDRSVVSQIAGVITEVKIQPGDTVKPGAHLFTVRIQSEVIQINQAELFKATRDLQINRENFERAQKIGEAIPARVVELENQDRRLKATIASYRQELATRGLSVAQIDAIAQGKFVTDINIFAPAQPSVASPKPAVDSKSKGEEPKTNTLNNAPFSFEVKELKAHLGEQIQVGQMLATLADHRFLLLEGRAFKQEASLLEKTAQNGWKISTEFTEEANAWPVFDAELKIRHLANSVDPVSRTFGFYIPLENQSRTYQSDGQTRLTWRFRPGQRVQLKIPIEQFEGVFVLPTDAVVREGPDSYIFRQNGNFFERKPVRVLLEERETILIADDGSVGSGQFVARNAASALNRAVKAQAVAAGGNSGHGHSHDH